jgi:hypothetical protein
VGAGARPNGCGVRHHTRDASAFFVAQM